MDNSLADVTSERRLVFQRKHEVVTSIKSRHRDITKEEENQERNMQIGLAAGAVIMLIATIIATYYASKATALQNVGHYDYNKIIDYGCHGHPIYKFIVTGQEVASFGVIAIVPGTVGGIVTISLGVGAACVNFEKKGRSGEDFSDDVVFADEMTHLTQDDIATASQRYQQGSLATGPLVDQRIITEGQAREIEGALRSYKEQTALKQQYESRSDTLKTALKRHPDRYPEYQKILAAIKSAKIRWRDVQKSIRADYTVQS